MFSTKTLLQKANTHPAKQVTQLSYRICKVDRDEQLVTGVVYSPFILDSHGHYMTAEDVKKTAHAFLALGLQNQIDIMHDNEVVNAIIVESYIQKEDDEFAPAGSWVATTKINDPMVWKKVRRGELNGYSMEIRSYMYEHEADIEYDSWAYGETMPDPMDGHTHFYLVKMDSQGNVFYGNTSQGGEDNHTHTITSLSVTDVTGTHTHRIVL
jgi:hypothetical protein